MSLMAWVRTTGVPWRAVPPLFVALLMTGGVVPARPGDVSVGPILVLARTADPLQRELVAALRATLGADQVTVSDTWNARDPLPEPGRGGPTAVIALDPVLARAAASGTTRPPLLVAGRPGLDLDPSPLQPLRVVPLEGSGPALDDLAQALAGGSLVGGAVGSVPPQAGRIARRATLAVTASDAASFRAALETLAPQVHVLYLLAGPADLDWVGAALQDADRRGLPVMTDAAWLVRLGAVGGVVPDTLAWALAAARELDRVRRWSELPPATGPRALTMLNLEAWLAHLPPPSASQVAGLDVVVGAPAEGTHAGRPR